MSIEFSPHLDIENVISSVGAHIFCVEPGLTIEPDGFEIFFTSFVMVFLQPFAEFTTKVMLKIPIFL